MGNTLSATIKTLGDPALVRKFQELCGVQEILIDNSLPTVPESECETDMEMQDTSNSEITNPNSKEQIQKSGHSRNPSNNSEFEQGHSREPSGDATFELKFKHGHSRTSSADIMFKPKLSFRHNRQPSDGTQFKQGHSRESSGEFQTKSQMNGNLAEWLKRKTKHRRRIKSSPSPSPSHSRTSSIDKEVDPASLKTDVVVETYPFFDVYFRLATECGYESFYITFFPFLFWNVDSTIAYNAAVLWAMSMYVGQACKQLFRIKRPANPPVFRLEQNPNLETEYGFPSTHAIVSTVMPFYFFYGTYGRYEYPFLFGLLLVCVWTTSVCLSRLYLGVHSLLDILGGMTISVIILLLAIPNIDTIDQFLIHSDYVPHTVIACVVILLYIYPVDPLKWTMDRGDTAAILASSGGAVVGFWLYKGYPDDMLTGPFPIVLPSIQCISLSIVRFIVGVLILLPTRFVMKLLCFKLLPLLMPTHGVKEVVHRPLVELPYKIITYGAIGFNAIYLAPHVFEICGISRQ